MKKILLFATAITALFATTSCSNEDNVINEEVDNSGKTRIALSGTDGEMAVSRAGFTNNTRIVARIVSDKRGGGDAKCVTTVLSAKAEAGSKGYSDVVYATGKTRYWDDAYGRNSILSVYAVAVPNVSNGDDGTNLPDDVLKGAETWGTSNASDNTLKWKVKTTQAYSDLAAEDLTYSNNIQQTGKNGVYTWDYTNGDYPTPTWDSENKKMNASQHGTDPTDGRLYFTQSADYTAEITDGPGHFDKGQMEFKHSLTRIQVNILKGEGYDALTGTTSVVLKSQPYTGTFDIKSAGWSYPETGDVTMAKWATAAAGKIETNEAQVLPGYTFADNGDEAIVVTIGTNKYFVTNQMLRTALTGKTGVNADFKTEMGNRYIFDITVKKNEITHVTATIVPWNEITADNVDVDNSHYKFTFYNNGNYVTSDVNLYKYMQTLGSLATGNDYSADPVASSADPSVTYSPVAGFQKVADKNYFTTSEFYQDNQTAYHFRSLNGVAQSALNAGDGKVSFTMSTGATDYLWGAPMKTGLSSNKLPYSDSKGYLDCIEKGIVAANTDLEANYINLTQVHMMSQLEIKLTSNSSDANAKVNLAGATVWITKFSKTGTVNIGSGLITPTTSYNDMTDAEKVTVAQEGTTGIYSGIINVVPQELKRNNGESDNDYVGITIHTADNNEYYIVKRLSEIKGTAGSQITNMQTADGYITNWYPGHKYIYTFNITKTEIKNITATIVDWNTVTAGNTELDLEK